MVRVAERIASRAGAVALVTGESLSQVSSQTLTNLATIDSVATMPILRPLIGLDKQEIIEEAEALGTFETSIEPHDDCCSFLMPRSPATYSSPEQLEEAASDVDVRTDVYSTGIVLFELLTGSLPMKPTRGHPAVVLQRLRERQRAALQPIGERLTLEVLHHDEERGLVALDVEDVHNIWMA